MLTMGNYNEAFMGIIESFLDRGPSIESKYKDVLLSDKGKSYFSTAFTHPSYNSENNYLFFKTIGHISYHKIWVWYISRNIPGIFTSQNGQQIVTILKHKLFSEKKMGEFANQSLFFWNYLSIATSISSSLEPIQPKDEKEFKSIIEMDEHNELLNEKYEILQNVCEAVLGVIEFLCDEVEMGAGNIIVYDLLTTIFKNHIPIPLDPSIIVQFKTSKSKLNDIWNYKKNFSYQGKDFFIGKIDYVSTINESNNKKYYHVQLRQMVGNRQNLLGEAIGKTKELAEERAASQGIQTIKKNGIEGFHGLTSSYAKVNMI